jgi:hypothetical protein
MSFSFQRSVAVASIVSQPSWSCAHRRTVLPSACNAPLTRVESRAHGLEPEARDIRLRHLATHQVHQQGGNQRAVHDQTGVALDLGDVLAVVVDAVAVERQCGIAEQQDIVRHDLALPWRILRRLLRWRHDTVGALRFSIDDLVELDQRRLGGIVAAQLVAHLDEHQGTGATSLRGHVVDRRRARHAVADADR